MKIAVIGGGSYCWTPTLFRDILFTEQLAGSEVVLEDINAKHLEDLHRCCKAILAQTGKGKDYKVSATMSPEKALRGADYVILTITTGGYDAMANDLRIPYRYGIFQPVGDTVGPGGISRSLRNVPVVVGLARQMQRWCPDAWLINITNPMSALTRCVWRETDIRCVGLCHELYGTLHRLQQLLGADDWRKDFECTTVGVNHFPWIIRLQYRGQDAFPLIRKAIRSGKGNIVIRTGIGTAVDRTLIGANRVKFALFEAFGALPAAGDRHLVEFLPYLCTPEMKKGAALGVKLTTIETRRNEYTPAWKKNVSDFTSGKRHVQPVVSQEAASRVICGLAGLGDWKDVVNIPNLGQIAELPLKAVVETMGFITRDHVHGLPVGPVPPAILTQLQRHVAVQEMTVEAAVKGDRSLALQAMLNDPLCGSIRKFGDMAKMLEALLQANRQWLPQFFGRR